MFILVFLQVGSEIFYVHVIKVWSSPCGTVKCTTFRKKFGSWEHALQESIRIQISPLFVFHQSVLQAMKFCLIATGSKQACLLTTCPFTVAETSESMSQETVSTFVHVYYILYLNVSVCLCACAQPRDWLWVFPQSLSSF